MSKSKFNVVNPDEICEHYGADTLRMYEMFLGPIEQAKPWNTSGISGVHSFIKKYWRLFYRNDKYAYYFIIYFFKSSSPTSFGISIKTGPGRPV